MSGTVVQLMRLFVRSRSTVHVNYLHLHLSSREARVAHAVSASPLTTEKKAKPSRGLDFASHVS